MFSEQKTLLMIEDQPIYSKVVLHALSLYPQYRVIHRPDGAQILSVIREHQPQLLILDYDLPGLNGIEIYDLVHAAPDLQHIPAIMVSANLPRAELVRRSIPGLAKPCRISELVEAIESALRQTISF